MRRGIRTIQSPLEIDWLLVLSKGKSGSVEFLVLFLSTLEEVDKILGASIVTVRPRQYALVFSQQYIEGLSVVFECPDLKISILLSDRLFHFVIVR